MIFLDFHRCVWLVPHTKTRLDFCCCDLSDFFRELTRKEAVRMKRSLRTFREGRAGLVALLTGLGRLGLLPLPLGIGIWIVLLIVFKIYMEKSTLFYIFYLFYTYIYFLIFFMHYFILISFASYVFFFFFFRLFVLYLFFFTREFFSIFFFLYLCVNIFLFLFCLHFWRRKILNGKSSTETEQKEEFES